MNKDELELRESYHLPKTEIRYHLLPLSERTLQKLSVKRRRIRGHFGGMSHLDETAAYKWIIDPLDGTTNFVHGLPMFCTSIACEYKGEIIIGAVYNPAINELFFAEQNKGAYLNETKISVSATAILQDSLLATGFYYYKGERLDSAISKFSKLKQNCTGVRRFGSAAIDLSYTACGRFDGYWEKDLSPWDVAAGLLIVKEAGGRISNYNGEECTVYDKEIMASNNLIHDQMIETIK